MDNIRSDIADTTQRNATIAATLRGLSRILDSGLELPDWGITVEEGQGEVILSLDKVTYCGGDRDHETHRVAFTFAELIDPDPITDLSTLAKQRWEEAKRETEAAARAEQARKQMEATEKVALGAQRNK